MLKNSEINQVKDAVQEAGYRILEYLQNENYSIEFKQPNDPVTTADYEANYIITNCIRKVFPDDVIVSEENYGPQNKAEIDEIRKTAKRLWIVDPLDGTKDFIRGLPYFAVSVGFFCDNQPEFGFIYNPAKKFLMYGGKNYGTFYNEKAYTRPSKNITSLDECKICISTSEIKKNLFSDLLETVPEDNIEFIGSVAYKLGLVAKGDFDLILSKMPKSDWDIAAGIALLYENSQILDRDFTPVTLNKEDILTYGLIVGAPQAVGLYEQFMGR